MLIFKPAFSFSSFTLIKKLFSYSSLSALSWCHLHIWGYWYFSQQSWFQLVFQSARHFTWCTLHIRLKNRVTRYSLILLILIGKVKVKAAQSCPALRLHRLYSPRNAPGQNTGVSSLSFLYGILPTKGSNPGLLYCRRILYQLSQQGSPLIEKGVPNFESVSYCM